MKIAQRVLRLFWILWAGSLWSMLWVAPVMFHFQSDRHLAGRIAASLFSIETYLGLALGLLALLLPVRRRFGWGYFAVGLLAFNEWVVKSVMEAARTQGSALGLGFGPWHGIAALIFLIAALSVAVLVWQEDFR